jgi:hypothetical protein
MLRISVVMTVLISMIGATENSVMAQRFTPFRNLGRPIGLGWGQGYHFQNPGPINRIYNSWSNSNTPGLFWSQVHDPSWENDLNGAGQNAAPIHAPVENPNGGQFTPDSTEGPSATGGDTTSLRRGSARIYSNSPTRNEEGLSVIRLVPENDVIENAYKDSENQSVEGTPAGIFRANGSVTPKRPANYFVPGPGQPGIKSTSHKTPGFGK